MIMIRPLPFGLFLLLLLLLLLFLCEDRLMFLTDGVVVDADMCNVMKYMDRKAIKNMLIAIR